MVCIPTVPDTDTDLGSIPRPSLPPLSFPFSFAANRKTNP